MKSYLRVMADYSSSGLWNREGMNVEPRFEFHDDHKLSPQTLQALKEWCSWYEQNDDYLSEDARRIPLFDLKSFSDLGFAIAKMIKHDLPDYEIVYFDEWAMTQHNRQARSKYEYEILGENEMVSTNGLENKNNEEQVEKRWVAASEDEWGNLIHGHYC